MIGIGIHGLGLAQTGAALLPLADDFARPDSSTIGNGWTGATWSISSNKAINTPTLGSELFLTGDFSADVNWTKGTNWTIAGGVAHHATSTLSNITQAVTVIGGWYREVWTLS